MVYLFALIGFIILLTAGLNYINLSTAMVTKRIKEIGIKKVVGASFKQIFLQVIIESLLVIVLAMIAAVGIAKISLPLLGAFLETPLNLDLYQRQIWLILIAVILLCLFISGVYPAILFANFKPLSLVKKLKKKREGFSMRKVLVTTQFVLTSLVLFGALIINQQLHFIKNMEVGYDREQVLNISPNLWSGDFEKNHERFNIFAEELSKLPDIKYSAGTTENIVKIESSNSGGLKWDDMPEDFKPALSTFGATEDLKDLFNLDMVEGNWFGENQVENKKAIIFNEKAIQMLQLPEPIIGQKVTFRNEERRIIGIVKDFHFENLHQEIKPLVINYEEKWIENILVKVEASNTTIALSKMGDLFKQVFPELPFKYNFIDETYAEMYAAESKMDFLFKIFTILLLTVSCLGLLGLSTFAVEKRSKEIGIRKVLGAKVSSILYILSKEFIFLIGIAFTLSLPLAWLFMQKWLQSYAYHIKLQLWMFVFVGLLVLAVSFIAISIQSLKAATTNPINSLRDE